MKETPFTEAAAPITAPLLDEDQPHHRAFLHEVLAGLAQTPKTLPCKFFYDAYGSKLFDRICDLGEYYLTRTEMAIMRKYAGEIVEKMGPHCLLVEYGSGSSLKTRILLDHLQAPAAYVPIDISREHLMASAARLAAAYPGLVVRPVCADYTMDFNLPPFDRRAARTVVYFPGSTIGNFEPAEAEIFLARMARLTGRAGGLLIGVDLKKDVGMLEAAYNDAKGVTAAFNLNLLRCINRELGGNFQLDQFTHTAFYNGAHGRVEMHLVSLVDQEVSIRGHRIRFRRGETIHTENSHKYTLQEFAALAGAAGLAVAQVWTDERQHFSVQYLVAAGDGSGEPVEGHPRLTHNGRTHEHDRSA